jgi:uncharacterized protein YjbI with pentapeptide repeats
MANPEHLKILEQGVETWNDWRIKNEEIKPYLEKADLVGADLKNADLRKADLRGARLGGADLRDANLGESDLRDAYLGEADLSRAYFMGADLRCAYLRAAFLVGANIERTDLMQADLVEADLSNARLIEAILNNADLRGAHLIGADLRGAYLMGADLGGAEFDDANLAEAVFGNTTLPYLSLDKISGLEKAVHQAPSHISTESFLRGCGLSDFEVEYAKLYNPNLNNQEINEILYRIYDLRAKRSIQISPLFISYSHTDNSFVDNIGNKLNQLGIRFWRDIHHATAGPLEKQIDLAIRYNPTVLLILSENSLQSDWVEHEVNTARDLEKEMKRNMLCPIALDDSWKDSPWPKRIMEQVMKYNILDFSKWEDESVFEKQFRKLLDGLDLFYK